MRRRANKFNSYRDRLKHQIYSVTYHRDGFAYKKYQRLGSLILIPVKEVLKLRDNAKVCDIEVGGNHSFLAGDAVFTHNCHTPNREAFDLYEWRMSKRSFHQKALYWSMLQPYRIIEHNIVPKIEYIFANSANTQERIRTYLHRDSTVLNPCVDYKEFRTEDYEKYFFYPSRIAPEKRFEYAISAFKEFKKKNKTWKLVIAGALMKERKEHVEYYHRIKDMLGGDGEIIIDVPHKKLIDLFSRCYSVLYTPVNEDFGIVPLEALASYKPCIAVNEGGPREVIKNGETGFLVDSEKEMAEKMMEISSNKSLAEKMGKKGRKHVEKNYSWTVFMKRFGEQLKAVSRHS
jgi:glycosyltransferase involved in cell wall biosynthesis